MSGIFNWFGTGSAGAAPPSTHDIRDPEEAAAAADWAPRDEYCGPSPFDTPQAGAKDRANYERILFLTTNPELNPRELKTLLSSIEPLLDHPNLATEGFDRDQVILGLYNIIHLLPMSERGIFWADHKSSFLFDKLIKATYDHFKNRASEAEEGYYPFYIQLFHQAVTSPSFTLLYDGREFFSQFDRFATQTGALLMVEGAKDKQFALDLLEKQLEYLALSNPPPESELVVTAVNLYLDTREKKTPIPVNVRLAISTLQMINPAIQKIEGLIPTASYNLTSLLDHPKKIMEILNTWVDQQNTPLEYFQMHNAIKDALNIKIIQPEKAIELQQSLLSRFVVRDPQNTSTILISLATLEEAAKPLEKSLRPLESVPIALDLSRKADSIIKAINRVIHKFKFLDPSLQRPAQQLLMNISTIQNQYLTMAREIAIKRASIRIDATHSQFNLPAINMKGSVPTRTQPQSGRGACLPIAAYTSHMLLRNQIQSEEDIKQAIYLGISRHQAILRTRNMPEGSHLESDNLEVFFPQLLKEADTGNALDKAFQLKDREEKRSYENVLGVMNFESDRQVDKKVAAVIRIRGAFLSILFDKSKGSSAITIADSHGLHQSGAYAYTFSSINDAATFLSVAYPYIEVDKKRSLDPINNGEVNYLILPRGVEDFIEEDRAYAEKSRLATGQKPYSYAD